MKIKIQVIISIVIFVIALLIIAASAVTTNQRVDRLNKQVELANKIEIGASELSYLSNDYLLFHEGQQLDVWNIKYASLSGDISNLTADTPEQQAIFDNIKANQLRLKEVFNNVESNVQGKNNSQNNEIDLAITQISWSRLGVQTRGIVFDSSRLSLMLQDDLNQVKQTNSLLIYTLLGTFILFLLIDYLLIYGNIVKSLSDLQAGTQIIGSGNFDVSLKVKKDEIGELANSFNQMTDRLKTVTASKTDLENEIAERKRAGEALQESEANLAKSQEIAHIGSWKLDLVTNEIDRSAESYRIFGLNPGQSRINYSEFLGFIVPEDREHVNRLIRSTVETGEPYTVTYNIRRKDGEVRTLLKPW